VTPFLLLAFALGLLAGAGSAWLATHVRRTAPTPAQHEFADLIAGARRRCNIVELKRRDEPPPGGAA
jgi:hypothetical protein